MLDITTEQTLGLAELARKGPRGVGDKPLHFSTLVRWITRGVRSPSGEVVRLEAARLGGRWVSSLEALQRFTDRLTPRIDDTPMPIPRSPGQRARGAEQARNELRRLGM
jgi:hypothetical protein